MITIKNSEQINKMRVGGKILAQVLHTVVKKIKVKVGTQELDSLAEELINKVGGRPSFKGYSHGGPKFPSTLCICLNDEIVHGPAVPNRIIKNHDIVSLDVGMEYDGMYTDMATTVIVGKPDPRVRKLVNVTKKSLELGIKEIKAGKFLQDISRAIENHVKSNGFDVVRDLVGHGVGLAVHEAPQIPNYVDRFQRPIVLKEGMTLAIEPMVVAGTWRIDVLDDDWTAVTADGAMAAHFEHTVLVTKDGSEILTKF